MKILNKTVLILLMALFTVNCDHFEELNIDPTTSLTPDAKSMLSGVIIQYSGSREVVWRSTAGFHMAFTQMVADGWAISNGQKYKILAGYEDYMWNSFYRYINDLQLVINSTEEIPEIDNYKSIARIMKALFFSQLTDTYGDIPYFEAVKGYDEGKMWPKYDTQKDIYYDLFKELKEASETLDINRPIENDLMFDGDIVKWKKFANSLRLRFALRLINVEPAKAEAEATAALAAGVMENTMDNAVVYHGNYNVSSTGSPEIRGNGFSQVQHYPEEIVVGCATYTDFLRDNNDPRFLMTFGVYGAYVENVSSGRPAFKSTTTSSVDVTAEYGDKYGRVIGFPAGKFLWDDTSGAGISWDAHIVEKDGKNVQIDKFFKAVQIRRELNQLDAPFIYMSYAEVELLKAESAVHWGLAGGDAKQHVLNGAAASIEDLEFVLHANSPSSSEVQAYLSDLDTYWDDAKALETINMQHYVNFFFNGIEAYANWRRSGFPELVPTNDPAYTDQALGGLIPRRLPYPNTEIQYNSTNVEAHLDNGINFWGKPVWWDGDKNRGVK